MSFLPEIAIAAGIIILVLAEILSNSSKNKIFLGLTFSIIVAALGLCFVEINNTSTDFLWQIGANSLLLKKIILATSLLPLAIAIYSPPARTEWYAIYLGLVLGTLLCSMAAHGLSLVIALELASLSAYLLIGLQANDLSISKSALEYVLFGILATALMLFGLSLIYVVHGSLSLSFLATQNTNLPSILSLHTLGFVLLLMGFLFKLSAVPMHFYVPEVYEGSPMLTLAAISTLPKIAGLAALWYWFPAFMAIPAAYLWLIFGLVAMASMLIGNILALGTDNMARIVAFSGIGHAGFIVAAIASSSLHNNTLPLYYITIYALSNIGLIYFIFIIKEKYQTLNISALAGLGSREPFLGIIITIILASLIGLPPLAGFTAKFLVISSIIGESTIFTVLAVAGVLSTVISLVYYFKIPFNLFLKNTNPSDIITYKSNKFPIITVFLVLIALALVYLGIKPVL